MHALAGHIMRSLLILFIACAFNTASYAQTPPPAADLGITVVDTPDPIAPGRNIEYVVQVSNAGQVPALDVRLALHFARGRGLTLIPPEGWSCTQRLSEETPPHPLADCTRAAMAPGLAAFRITLFTTFGPGPIVASEGIVSSTTPDPNAQNNRAVAETTITGSDPSADLAVTLRAFGFASGPPGPFVILDRASVRNLGPDVARDVTFEVPLPAGTMFDVIHGTGSPAINTPRGLCQTPLQGESGTVRCTVDGIAPGESFSPYIRTRVLPAFVDTVVTATASASATNPDPNPGNNQATDTALPQSPAARADLAISVVAHPSPVAPGGNLVHDVTITNLGPQLANGLSLSIGHPLGLGLEFETPTGLQCSSDPVGIPPPIVSSSCWGEVVLGVEPVRIRIRSEVSNFESTPVTLSFQVVGITPDPNPTNDATSVTTPLGIGSGVPVPTLSPALLALLALLLAALGMGATFRRY